MSSTLLYAPSAETTVAALDGEIGTDTVDSLEQRLSDALATGHRHVVIDLLSATRMGTEALSRLLVAARRLGRSSELVVLAGLPPHVRRIVEISAVERLEVAPTVEAALARLAAGTTGE